MRPIATALMLAALICAPITLILAGLWLGLTALHWPPALAVVGLSNLYPKPGTPLALLAWFSRPAAAAGFLFALLL